MWGVQKKNEGGDEAEDEFKEGDIPPWFYLSPHPDAKLSESEIKELSNGLLATFDAEEDENGLKKIMSNL